MKKETVKNLVIGTSVFLGIGLAVNYCLKIKKEKEKKNKAIINKALNEKINMNSNQRVYYTLGTVNFPKEENPKTLTKEV